MSEKINNYKIEFKGTEEHMMAIFWILNKKGQEKVSKALKNKIRFLYLFIGVSHFTTIINILLF